MNYNPLVSIITVCYNSEKYIGDAIESVLCQSYKNIEYIIIDGKSTDRTIDIIKSYQDNFFGRLNLVSEKDNGIYDAMNKGIRLARGEIVGIINSDDYYEKDTVDTVINEYNGKYEKVIYGLLRFIKDGLELMTIARSHNFIDQGMIPHPTCFVPKKFYEKYGDFNVKFKYCADYDFIIRLKANNVPFKKMDKILANFRIDGASYSIGAKLENYKILYSNGYISKTEAFYRTITDNINFTLFSTFQAVLKLLRKTKKKMQ